MNNILDLFYAIILMCVFLFLGYLIKEKIKFFKYSYINSSIIGGFLFLFINSFAIIKIKQEYIEFYRFLPSVLIIPVLACAALGIKFNLAIKTSKNILILALIISAVSVLQFIAGLFSQYIFDYDFYKSFGLELSIAYAGGHASAGVLASILRQLNISYYEQAQSVAITLATFGLLGAIVLGILFINIAKKYKICFNDLEEKEEKLKIHLSTFILHLIFILFICFIAYFVLKIIKFYDVFILKNISIWAYAMIIMLFAWLIIIKAKKAHLINNQIKSKISSIFSEFAIICAISSMEFKIVAYYWQAILYMIIIGYILTASALYFMCKYLIKEDYFAYMMATFGCLCGVFLTGILLLKLLKVDYKSQITINFSLAYTLSSIFYFAILNYIVISLITNGLNQTMLFISLLAFSFIFLAIIIAKLKFFKS